MKSEYENCLGHYVCDAGSLLLTDESNKTGFLVSNGYGDTTAEIFFIDKNFKKDDEFDKRWEFVTTILGNFNVHYYDCDLSSEVLKTIKAERCAIYYAKDESGNMLIERWD